MTSRWKALAVLVALTASAAVTVPATATSTESSDPTITTEPTDPAASETVAVEGTGWMPATVVKVELCGNAALDLTLDCDQTTSHTAVVHSDGTFRVQLQVVPPPTPCPCLVRASAREDWVFATSPVDIQGVPVAAPLSRAPRPAGPPMVEVDAAWVTDSNPLQDSLGIPTKRTLVLLLRNSGTSPVTDPALTAASTEGEATPQLLDMPPVGTLQPGQTYRLEAPFSLGVLAPGNHLISGTIGSPGAMTSFETSTTVAFPWGLVLMGLIAVTLLSWRAGAALRRRLYRPRARHSPSSLKLPIRAPHMTVRAVAVVLAAVAVLGSGRVAGAQEEAPLENPPLASVAEGDGGEIGDELIVAGEGWAPFDTLSASICGNNGESGSLDCTSLGRTFLSDSEGGILLSTRVLEPPSSCPCIVRVRSVDTAAEAFAPITIAGMEVTEDAARTPLDVEEAEAPLVVTDVSVSGGGWQGWVGLPTQRTLELTIANPSTEPVAKPPISTAWGRGSDPRNLITVPPVDDIAPGESVTVTTTFDMGPLAYGSYEIAGEIGPSWASTPFGTSMSTWPWALFLVLIAGLAWLIWRRVKKRRRNRAKTRQEPPQQPAALPPGPATLAPPAGSHTGNEETATAPSPALEHALAEELSTRLVARLRTAPLTTLGSAGRRELAYDVGLEVVQALHDRFDLSETETIDLADKVASELVTSLDTATEPTAEERKPAPAI